MTDVRKLPVTVTSVSAGTAQSLRAEDTITRMIPRRFATIALALLVTCLVHTSPGFATEIARSPNIILVFIDDMGWADLSCFGNLEAQTPHIDRMATEGIAFEQFYVNSPICSPSRVAISTGQYPQQWGITSYLADREKNQKRDMVNWLDPAAPSLARTFQAAGYRTGHFGKWHMGGQRDVDDAPPIADYGFDESLTNFEGMGAKLLPLTMRPGDSEPGRIWEHAERLGEPVTWMQRSEITGGFVDAALQFIAQAQEDNKPFYINLWPDDVHSPFFPPVEKWGDSKRALYLAVLEEMDRQLGALFDHVRDDPELRKDTVILICSDNGHEPGAGQGGVLKGSKGQLYEGGIRSPLIVWAPGRLHPEAINTRNKTSVLAAIDLVPSLLAISGVNQPEEKPYDGLDLHEVLLGQSQASRSAPLFFSRPPHRKSYQGFVNLPDLAVRDGLWKLLCNFDGSDPQLYDIPSDPGETKNLADANPVVVKELTEKVLAWYGEMQGRAAKLNKSP